MNGSHLPSRVIVGTAIARAADGISASPVQPSPVRGLGLGVKVEVFVARAGLVGPLADGAGVALGVAEDVGVLVGGVVADHGQVGLVAVGVLEGEVLGVAGRSAGVRLAIVPMARPDVQIVAGV